MHQRDTILYTSESDSVAVYVQSPGLMTSSVSGAAGPHRAAQHHLYLIKYQAVGCPDISDLENGVVERREDVAVVRCNSTGETFFLTCSETRWKGEMSRCAPTPALPTRSSPMMVDMRHHVSLSATSALHGHGLLVVISIGVALGVAVGVFILFALVLCHRRRKAERRRRCMVTADRLLVTSPLSCEFDLT